MGRTLSLPLRVSGRPIKRRIEGISYFPQTVALSGLDKVRPPHLTRETLSGRRPADGVVGCVYESFVPGGWHRWLEKEILWFCFRRAEPERMISGWTASSRDSSKTEEGKAPRGYGQIRSELRMSSKLKLSRILPL